MERGEISSEWKRKDLEIIIIHDDEQTQEFPLFCWSAEMNFHSLAGPKNMSVDLKWQLESGEVKS